MLCKHLTAVTHTCVVIKSCSIELGRMRGSLVTLQKLVQLFPSDTSIKNDLGVGYLLIGDNSNAKKVYEEVSFHPRKSIICIHMFILKIACFLLF